MYQLNRRQKTYLFFKSLIAFFGSLLAILLLGWLIFIIFIINLFVTKGHPFFVQERVGKNGKMFKMIKFRSMLVTAPKMVTSEEIDDPYFYCTKFGKFLRKTSLDEWPQIFNIFVGKMSFIGPRPVIMAGRDLDTVNERKNNGAIVLKPGLTGLAQISGRVNLDPVAKAKVDGEYLRTISLWKDIEIFFRTIFKVFKSDDVAKNK